MSDPHPPDSENLPPITHRQPEPSPEDLFEPELPHYIPLARPVSPLGVPYASPARMDTWPLRVPPGRAIVEMVTLIPMGFAGIIMGFIVARALGVRDERWVNLAATGGMGVSASLTAALFVALDGHSAASIGWTARAFFRQIGAGILALILTYVGFFVLLTSAIMLFPSLQEQQPTAEQAVREMLPNASMMTMIGLMLLVAVWEEVVFRGFVLTRLKSLTGRWWLAVPLGAVIFGSVHLYEGPLAVVLVTLLGVVLAVVFILRRSLVPCIIMHFIHNSLMMAAMRYGLFQP